MESSSAAVVARGIPADAAMDRAAGQVGAASGGRRASGFAAGVVRRCGGPRRVAAGAPVAVAVDRFDRAGGGGKGTSGILAHTELAVTLAGRPLGLFELNAAFRSGKTADGMEPGPEVNDKESARWLRGLDRAQELAAACPGTRVVNICDREGDFWELLCKAASDGARLLVRASRSAQRQVILDDGRKADLWEHLAGQPRLATQTLELAACGGKRTRKKRTVHIDIRATEVRLAPPQTAAGQPPVRMLAVSATETPQQEERPALAVAHHRRPRRRERRKPP